MSNERCMCGAIDCSSCGPPQGYIQPFEDINDEIFDDHCSYCGEPVVNERCRALCEESAADEED